MVGLRKLPNYSSLSNKAENFSLDNPNSNVFLYHLHLLQLLEKASREQLYSYHIGVVRGYQYLKISLLSLAEVYSSYTLTQIGVKDAENALNIINSLSHKDVYYYQSDLMVPAV